MPGPDYKGDNQLCKEFLSDFVDANGELKYMNILQDVANRTLRTVEIELDDLDTLIAATSSSYLALIMLVCDMLNISCWQFKDSEALVQCVRTNTWRYISIFAEAVDELLPEPTVPYPMDDDVDILMTQRLEENTENTDSMDTFQKMPPEIKRLFEVYIKPFSKEKAFTIQEVNSSYIGQLVKVSGLVTRCSNVKPLVQVAVYTCEECGFEIYHEVTARVYMPLFECPSTRCKNNKSRGNLILQLRASKFMKFQEAKIQELSQHVPKGCPPRSLTIHIRGELTRKVGPGDVVEISGIFLPISYTGFRAMKAGLLADTFLEALSITHSKKRYEEHELGEEEEEQIRCLQEEGDLYNKLARSLAPEIFGHEDVKKALLLQLVSAPDKTLKDGMKIRGDLHICLMGDPGVAKSQLLKHIIKIAPRGVYTTGRGSSGVGLTASVQKDPVTGEMVLEGGALVLADKGICGIDEFDKMDESDRTAIHEVMEQQTVSIAKAGITTSLNARTAVLAAANPAWFDLLWLILDRADMDSDLEMARHVTYVLQHQTPPSLGFNPIEPSLLRAFIPKARKENPSVPDDLTEYVATVYASMRQVEAKTNTPHSYTTVRTLLSILRLAMTLARLRPSKYVSQSDIDEALRLMRMSKFSLYSDERRRSGLDAISDIYSIIRDEASRMNTIDVGYAHALNWISRKGYSEAQLKECLEEYASLNVWQIHPHSFDVRFFDAF